jgi:CMP-N,N'-diacetyllegionaminic acid synthase
MRILAIIPARGGSFRLPGKNVRPLLGKPLITWTIDYAFRLNNICSVLVTTDSPEIARIAKKNKALVPWLRPPQLATADASSVDVVLHALNWYEKSVGPVDGILLLQPTSPIRNIDSSNDQIERFLLDSELSIIGVKRDIQNPTWTLSDADGLLFKISEMASSTDSLSFSPCGNFYLISVAEFREKASFAGSKLSAYIIHDEGEIIDIDTIEEFQLAEKVLKERLPN